MDNVETIDNNLKKGKKNTGISNMFLPKDFGFYHSDILISVFASRRISNKASFKEFSRVYNERITVYGDFLNMDTDFLLYTFLLEKLERQNSEVHKDYINLEVSVSYSEIHEFFGKELLKKGGREIFVSYRRSLYNLNSVSLKIDSNTVSLIEKFEDHWDLDFDQHREFKVTFPEEIKNLTGGQSLLDYKEYNSLKTQSHKKLYAYIFSGNVTRFKYETLIKVLGFKIEHEINGKNVIVKNFKDARNYLKTILSDFYWDGLIEHSPTFDERRAKYYDIVQSKNKNKSK